MSARLSVVIPALNEARSIGGLLAELRRLRTPHEVIVVDGGSRDGTAEVAAAGGAHVVRAPAGRGVQLAAGARAARSPLLCFLHADVLPALEALHALETFSMMPDPRGARAFTLRIDADGPIYRIIERGVRLRTRWLGLPYGDQGLVVTRRDYEAVGGHPPLPVMEDVALVRALRKVTAVELLPAELHVSARRWERDGPLRRTAANALLLAAYLAGVEPVRLARWYGAMKAAGDGDGEPGRALVEAGPRRGRDRLLIFARRPLPGRVKTRLTPVLSPQQAASFYEACVHDVVELAAAGPVPPELLIDGAGDAVDFFAHTYPTLRRTAQSTGDLGARLFHAFQATFSAGARRVVVLGTDSPTLPPEIPAAAFRALEGRDVVLGPARDGGYYLIGLSRRAWPRAAVLFHSVAWSTARVLDTTLRNATGAGLRVGLLDEWYDVDRPADLAAAVRHARPGSRVAQWFGNQSSPGGMDPVAGPGAGTGGRADAALFDAKDRDPQRRRGRASSGTPQRK